MNRLILLCFVVVRYIYTYIYIYISSNQRTALHDLKGNNEIVTKHADKGSSIVIMEKDTYMKESCAQLQDGRLYQKIDNVPTPT